MVIVSFKSKAEFYKALGILQKASCRVLYDREEIKKGNGNYTLGYIASEVERKGVII